MTVRLSTALRNAKVGTLGFTGALRNGYIGIYSGSQPASADAAFTGTLLGKVTNASGTIGQETQASQTITIAGTIAGGTISAVTIGGLNVIPGGAVAGRTDATTTAGDLADAINRDGLFTASSVGAVVTVKPRPGAGATYNAVTFAASVTGSITATVGAGTLSGGAAGSNGLILTSPSAGVVSKSTLQVWSFNGSAAGVAGWARFYGSVSDDGSSVSTLLPRLDGSVATSGGDFSLSNITIAIGAPNTCDGFTWTQPAA